MTAATIRHAHAPQQHTDPRDQRVAAIAASFDLGTDTVGRTELETVDQVQAVHARMGWGTYWPRANEDGTPEIVTVAGGKRRPAAANAVTVSWRTDVWVFVRGRSRQIHGGRANVSPSRFITEVWLRNIATGVVVRFVESHWISGVQPIFKSPADYRRTSLAASRVLMRKVLAAGNTPTIVSLDANTTRLPQLVDIPGLVWEKTGGTHGTRQIDWIGHRDLTPVQLDVKSTRRKTLKFLDHKATIATFSLVSADDHQEPEMPTILRTGTDPNGRSVLMTPHMERVWKQILADPAVAPFAPNITIVQGAFMSTIGGGAPASAGYHDQAGCLDIRTWNLTGAQLEAFIRAARRNGFAFWRRDKKHGGMDPHAHGVLGTDGPLSSGAASQWRSYVNGRDGLASNGSDYEWRPSPLVLTPPRKDWFDMADINDLKQALREVLPELLKEKIEVDLPNGNKATRTVGQLLARDFEATTEQGKKIRETNKNTQPEEQA